MGNNNGSSGGIGVAGLLGVAFIILKLTGVINWSWLWVLCPFWIGLAIGLGIMLIVFVVFLLALFLKLLTK